MSSDNHAELVLDADVSPFKQKLREATADLKRFGDEGKGAFERMTGPLGALQSTFLRVGALLGGGKIFAAAIEESTKLTSEANALSKALGISTTEAGALNIALGDIYSGADDFIGASQQLSRQLRTNEDDLNAMGLQTRDANGEYRNMKDLMFDSIDVLKEYKEGTDRTLAAQTMFGRGAGDVASLLKLTNDVVDQAREKQAALGLTIGMESVESTKQYKASMNDVGDVLSGFKKAIGDAVMPMLTTLGNWFSELGPAGVLVTKGAIGGLVSLFWGFKFAVEAVWNTFAYFVEGVTVRILQLSDVAMHAFSLDFSGAKEAWDRGAQQLEEIADKRFKNILDSASETREKMWNLFANPTEAAPVKSSGKNYVAPPPDAKKAKADPSDDAKKDKADPSMMAYYEAALAAEKQLASEKDALRDYTKAEELAFWQTLLKHAQISAKDRTTIEKKSAELTVAIRKQEAKDLQDMTAETTRFDEAMALGRVDAAQAAAEAAVDAGQITQMQLLEMEMQFESQRLEIQRAALIARLKMAEADPNTSDVEKRRIQNQILQLEQQSGTKMIQLQRKVGQQSGQIWADLGQRMSGMWDKGITSLMNGTFRWRNAFKAVGLELVNWFASTVVGGMVKEHAAGLAKTLAAKISALFAEQTAQKTGSAIVVATKSTETTAVSGNNAVQAATGAAGAMASIPWVGPVLAIAAMGAMFAAVSAMGSKVKSASKGYAIPKGVNPLMQLHEEEVVLPSHLSKGIGQLIENGMGGGGSGGGNTIHMHVNSASPKDMVRALKDGGALHKALKDYDRRFMSKS